MLDTVCCASACTGLAPPALGRPGTCQLPLQCLQPNPTGEDLNFNSHQIPTRQMLVTSSPLPLSQIPMHSELGCVTPWLGPLGPWSEAELEHRAPDFNPSHDKSHMALPSTSPFLPQVPMHSELGCVTPWLVAPGPWSEAELEHHARALAQAVLNNCSCNCLSAKVGVQGGVGREGEGTLGCVDHCVTSTSCLMILLRTAEGIVCQLARAAGALPNTYLAPCKPAPTHACSLRCAVLCCIAQVVLLPEGWEQGDALIAKFKAELAKYPLPNPYYPGIRERSVAAGCWGWVFCMPRCGLAVCMLSRAGSHTAAACAA